MKSVKQIQEIEYSVRKVSASLDILKDNIGVKSTVDLSVLLKELTEETIKNKEFLQTIIRQELTLEIPSSSDLNPDSEVPLGGEL
mgnify:CR=1 FL=1